MSMNDQTQQILKKIIQRITPLLDEKQRRLILGVIASEIGRGGIVFVSNASGASRSTIYVGEEESDFIDNTDANENVESDEYKGRIRKPGGGRKPLTNKYPDLHDKIQSLIDNDTYGNPENPLVWTTWSVRKIADELEAEYGISIHFTSVGKELDLMGYSRQQNQKMKQVGDQHPDRNAQFLFINEKAKKFLKKGDPVISIDTKKKENIGNFKNNGSEYRKKGNPRQVLDHDFPIPELGKVAPYGVYVVNNNTGFINLGTSHDTPEFAGESVSLWWRTIGKKTFRGAKRLYITCDNGGSNGSRLWMWKYYLQKISNKYKLEIHVSHFPPGTSKWNKIEHRMFCYISKNWQGQPLIDIETVVNLISSTTTSTGLEIDCKVDLKEYELGQKIDDVEKEKINIEYIGPNKNWNYVIRPNV